MAGNDLTVLHEIKAEVVFAPGGVSAILAKLEAEVRATKTDVTTRDGRAAIASLAYKVARSKTALDDMGKDLNADLKKRAGEVDAERRKIRERLDALRDEVRRPLDEFEAAEELRITRHQTALAEIEALAIFSDAEPPSVLVMTRQTTLAALQAPPREWQEFSQRYAETVSRVTGLLQTALERAVGRETERAELDRLRREAQERQQRERDEQIAAEAAARERQAAEERAAEERQRAQAEQERLAREAREAQEARNREQQRREQAERDREAADARAAESERLRQQEAAEAAERARIREQEAARDREAAAERERQAAVDATAAERQRTLDEAAKTNRETREREADKQHRAKINNEIVARLQIIGASQPIAKAIVTALARDEVPHVRIAY